MASISNDANGRRRILFVDADGTRRTIYLSKLPLKAALALKLRVEALVSAKLAGHAPDDETARWLANLNDAMYAKLAAVGLIPPRQTAALIPFCEAFLESQHGLKPGTLIVRQQVINNLREFFGADRDVRTVTPGDADDFKQFLVGKGLSTSTIHKRLQWARWFFQALLRRRLIAENPFADVRCAATNIRDKQRFITRDETQRLLEAAPDHHWRVIIALARFGGLRCPSEVLSLRWEHIDWERNRITVPSPKTEHHAGRDCRVIPLFPELKPILSEAFELAPEGAIYVVAERFRRIVERRRGVWLNANLRTQFERIIRRAGLQAWSRPFHNLRASRETELVERFPIQVVTDWLGNTPSVAMKHYLITTEQHFQAALERDAKDDARTTQKTTQRQDAPERGIAKLSPEALPAESVMRLDALTDVQLHYTYDDPKGIRTYSNSLGKTRDFERDDAPDDARVDAEANLAGDPLLARFLEAWARLPADDRLSLVEDAERLLEDLENA